MGERVRSHCGCSSGMKRACHNQDRFISNHQSGILQIFPGASGFRFKQDFDWLIGMTFNVVSHLLSFYIPVFNSSSGNDQFVIETLIIGVYSKLAAFNL